MPFSLRSMIFSLFGNYEKEHDINKDVNGKGTLERYNEIVGKDVDDNLLPLIEGLADNIQDATTIWPELIIYKEDERGIMFAPESTDRWRRRVLQYAFRWASIKGTKKFYKLLFPMFGLGVTITEHLIHYSFDSAVTFDDDDRRFDMFCLSCQKYSIDLTGAAPLPLTDAKKQAIQAILEYNQPVNAVLKSLTYNSTDVGSLFTWNKGFKYEP